MLLTDTHVEFWFEKCCSVCDDDGVVVEVYCAESEW